MKTLIRLTFLFLLGLSISGQARAASVAGGGGGKQEKEKKTKHLKSLKKARSSAKYAKAAAAESRNQVMMLAKTRNFFHSTFNTKPGTFRNFRSHRVQSQWKKSNSNRGFLK